MAAKIDVDQGQAKEGAGALVLVPPGVDHLYGLRRGVLDTADKVIQGDVEVIRQGGEVVHVRLGCARLPLLYRLPGDVHDVGQFLLGKPGLTAELVETFTKFHE